MTPVLLAALVACSTPEPPAPTTPPQAEVPKPPEAPPAEPEVVVPEKGVYFVSPTDGAVVSNPVKVEMGVAGMTVQPAGEVVEGTGHHHIIIDTDAPAAGETVPKDDKHIHYGDGSTQTELTLTPGVHALTLQFANGVHASYGPDWSATIKVTVEGEALPADGAPAAEPADKPAHGAKH